MTENHYHNWQKLLCNYELFVSDHHRQVRCLRTQAQKVDKTTVNIEDRLETVVSRCPTRNQLAGACSVAIGQFCEGLIHDYFSNLRKCLSVHRHQFCRTCSKISFAIDTALKASVAGLRLFAGGSGDISAVKTKTSGGPDPPSCLDTFCPKAIAGLSISVSPDANVVCSSVPWVKSAEDVSNSAEGHLEFT